MNNLVVAKKLMVLAQELLKADYSPFDDPETDDFDKVAAVYHWLNDNHGGQWSEEYKLLSMIITKYKPNFRGSFDYSPSSENFKLNDDNRTMAELYEYLDSVGKATALAIARKLVGASDDEEE